MALSILTTKLYIPPSMPGEVFRPQLIKKLNEGLKSKLTLISASTGFGKTTLLSQWTSKCKKPIVWLSLDEDFKDIRIFISYFIASLQKIVPNTGEGVLAALQLPQTPVIDSIITSLINEITTFKQDFILILDDYYLVDSTEVDNFIFFLIEHLPDQMHIVIATREDPVFPLARLRVRGQLNEIRAADLRFSPIEAASFLNREMKLNLSDEHISALENRTEGWIAGLYLAAISLKDRTDAATFINTFSGSNRFILDYLVEEVLQQQTDEIQKFLLQTSILTRLCAPLCDAVVFDDSISGQETLEFIEQSNIFIIPLDDQRTWYRYHHLFRELLKQKLDHSEYKDISELHKRASIWFEQSGNQDDAINHAFLANDLGRTADLLESTWHIMESHFQSAKWLDLVKLLPDQLISLRPVLCAAYARALLQAGEIDHIIYWLDIAEEWLDSNSKKAEMIVIDKIQFMSLAANITITRAYLAQIQGDFKSAKNYASSALKLSSEQDFLIRAGAFSLIGAANWAIGNLNEAYSCFYESIECMKKNGDLISGIVVSYYLGEIAFERGQLNEAFKIFSNVIYQAENLGTKNLWIKANLLLGLSKLLLERGDFESAEKKFEKSNELRKFATFGDLPYISALVKADILLFTGSLDEAISQLNKAEELYFLNPAPNIHLPAELKSRIWIKQGNFVKARAWVKERRLDIEQEISYLNVFELITFARLLIEELISDGAKEQLPDVNRLLKRLSQTSIDGGWNSALIEILILQAIVYEQNNSRTSALTSLTQALTIAEPEGYINIFVDEGLVMKMLLSQLIDEGENTDYINKLLSSFQKKRDSVSPPVLLEALSPREMEVLHLISLGLSNQEISDRLFLALTTIKGYNQRLFGKLQVQRRTEAIARASELGLLKTNQNSTQDST